MKVRLLAACALALLVIGAVAAPLTFNRSGPSTESQEQVQPQPLTAPTGTRAVLRMASLPVVACSSEPVRLEVWIDDTPPDGIIGVQISFRFDPQVIQIERAELGALDHIETTTQLAGGWIVAGPKVDNENGRASVGVLQIASDHEARRAKAVDLSRSTTSVLLAVVLARTLGAGEARIEAEQAEVFGPDSVPVPSPVAAEIVAPGLRVEGGSECAAPLPRPTPHFTPTAVPTLRTDVYDCTTTQPGTGAPRTPDPGCASLRPYQPLPTTTSDICEWVAAVIDSGWVRGDPEPMPQSTARQYVEVCNTRMTGRAFDAFSGEIFQVEPRTEPVTHQ